MQKAYKINNKEEFKKLEIYADWMYQEGICYFYFEDSSKPYLITESRAKEIGFEVCT